METGPRHTSSITKSINFGRTARVLLATVAILGVAGRTLAQDWSYHDEHDFGCAPYDGATPIGTPIYSEGNLYGLTSQGGSSLAGTLFEVKAGSDNVQDSVLYMFGTKQNDAISPVGNLVLMSGSLYGASKVGSGTLGNGTIFVVNPKTKKEKVIHSFDGYDGAQPYAGLIASNTSANTLYGTTVTGGNSWTLSNMAGTVFAVNTSGALTTLYDFCSKKSQGGICLDGALPQSGLYQDSAGYLYGTTYAGGKYNLGTVYKLDPKSYKEIWVYSFGSQNPDGMFPQAGLVFAHGYLYGTTSSGGAGKGTIFAISASKGTETVIWNFQGSYYNDGQTPMSDLVVQTTKTAGTDLLYGTTLTGGDAWGDGTVFQIAVHGNQRVTYQVFLKFSASVGKAPWGGLTLLEGVLYGTTTGGGAHNCGVVFSLNPPAY
jgi:uncharacterized repeat protein (TIGR03803 family)